MPARKRRRSQAFGRDHSQDAAPGSVASNEDDVRSDDVGETVGSPNGAQHEESVNKEVSKEAELWEAFKEEYHEALEQLPLQLHRYFALMKELDEEATRHAAKVTPVLQQYISVRRSLAGLPARTPDPVKMPLESPESTPLGGGDTTMKDGTEAELNHSEKSAFISRNAPSPHAGARNPFPSKQPDPVGPSTVASLSTQRTPISAPVLLESQTPFELPRELLSQVACLAEDAVQASLEKVHIAQAAYNSVDRHIRMLDRAIKEQEDALSLDLHPGYHPALLPDLLVPRWTRGPRIESSPLPGFDALDDENMDVDVEDAEVDNGDEESPAFGLTSGDVAADRGRNASKKSKKGKGRKKEKDAAERDTSKATTPAPQPNFKLKIPPSTAVVSGDLPVHPNEPKYCYCDQVSYGHMVACDNAGCKREWFHLSCAGLTEPPKSTKWYCRECTGKRKGR